MKIAWLSNKRFTPEDKGSTGTWLDALAKGLSNSGSIELCNITTGGVKKLTFERVGKIDQWVIPHSNSLPSGGLPIKSILEDYKYSVSESKPELIHVWGTESYKGLLTARKILDYPSLLETQGIISAISCVYYGGLKFNDLAKTVGLKEIIKSNTLWQARGKFSNWMKYEDEIIKGHTNITVQSTWLEAQIKTRNQNALIHYNDFALREVFYLTPKWDSNGSHRILCSSAYSSPFKGIHDLIRSISLVQKIIPEIELRIAGNAQLTGLRRDGYTNYLNKLVKSLNLENSVKWLGPLNAEQLAEELKNSSAYVIPSYVEGYSLALAEAMLIGTPCVCAFNGGTSHLAKDEYSALFFQPGDYRMCSHHIVRLLHNQQLSKELSLNARNTAQQRNELSKIIAKQISVYTQILESNAAKRY